MGSPVALVARGLVVASASWIYHRSLKDPNYDLRDGKARTMRAAELFRFCVTRVFTD